jgi:hypothetical protein
MPGERPGAAASHVLDLESVLDRFDEAGTAQPSDLARKYRSEGSSSG